MSSLWQSVGCQCDVSVVAVMLQRDETTDAQLLSRITKLAEQALERCVPSFSFLRPVLLPVLWISSFYCRIISAVMLALLLLYCSYCCHLSSVLWRQWCKLDMTQSKTKIFVSRCGSRATRNLYSVGKIYITSALLHCKRLCACFSGQAWP